MKQILALITLLLLHVAVPDSALLVAAEKAGPTLLSTGESVDTFVNKMTKANTIMVFAKSYCPHCRQTKQLLERSYSNVQFKIVNLDQLSSPNDGFKIQTHLSKITGQWTVPNIFVHHQPVGGNSELQQLHASGRLRVLLKAGTTGRAGTGSSNGGDEL